MENKRSLVGLLKENRMKVILVLLVATVVAYFLQERYSSLILCLILINTIAVTGLDILFGYTGQVSFGHAGYYAIGAYTSTIISIRFGLPPILTILLGSILSMIFGVIIAFPASKLVKHFLSLLSIAFGQMVYMFISVTYELTNGFSGIMGIPNISIFGYEFSNYQSYFFLFLIIVIIVLISKKRIIESRVGRAFIAIRENPQAAAGMGVNVRYYKVLSFAISAFLTGLAGGLMAHLVGFISPDSFTNVQSNLFMTMLLFGGISSLMGPIIGSTVLIVVTEVLQGLLNYQMLFYGIFILLVLFFLPNGVIGILDTFKDIINTKILKRGEKYVTNK